MICPVCGINLSSRQSYERHLQQHEDESQLCDCLKEHCSYRGNVFNLWQHQSTAHKETNFNCYICENLFHSKSNFNRHIKNVHENGQHRSFKCTTCGAELSSNWRLQQHQETHIKYERGQCGKLFSKEMLLDKHMKTAHDNLKISPSCLFCKKQFSNKSALNKHKKMSIKL